MISSQRFVDWKFRSYRERYEEFHIAYLALINPTSFVSLEYPTSMSHMSSIQWEVWDTVFPVLHLGTAEILPVVSPTV